VAARVKLNTVGYLTNIEGCDDGATSSGCNWFRAIFYFTSRSEQHRCVCARCGRWRVAPAFVPQTAWCLRDRLWRSRRAPFKQNWLTRADVARVAGAFLADDGTSLYAVLQTFGAVFRWSRNGSFTKAFSRRRVTSGRHLG
jgi:hypothetical protein